MQDEQIGIEYQYAPKRYAYSRAALRMAPILWRHAMLRGDETFLATTLRVFIFNHVANFVVSHDFASRFHDVYKFNLSNSASRAVVRLSASVQSLSSAAHLFAEAEVMRVREEKGEAPLGRHTDWVSAGYDALARSDGDPQQMLIEAKNAFGLEPVSAGFEEFDRLLSAELREKFGEAPRGRPLWVEDSPLAEMWIEVRTWLQSQSPKWDFWIGWYDDVLAGREPDREFLCEVALIPDDVWPAGVDAVAQAIDTIIAGGSSTDKGETIDPDPIPTQRQHLQRNARAITLQLGSLQSFVTEEIEQLRGQNSLSNRERDKLDERIAKLKLILDSVALMIEAFEGELGEGLTALAVVEAQLPVVVGAADEAVKLGGAPEMSAVVVSMAATTKYLTEAGAPGSLAVCYAFTEMCWGKVKGLLKPR